MKVHHYREVTPLSVRGIEETTAGLVVFVCSVPKAALTAYYIDQADRLEKQ
ncbi:MAG: hypothetical protein ACT4OP_01235 [Actinomycetota bacterium]